MSLRQAAARRMGVSRADRLMAMERQLDRISDELHRLVRRRGQLEIDARQLRINLTADEAALYATLRSVEGRR